MKSIITALKLCNWGGLLTYSFALIVAATPFTLTSQSNSFHDVGWSYTANLSTKESGSNEVVGITNNNTIDSDLEFNGNAKYTINSSSIKGPKAGKRYKIKINDSSYLKVNGNVYIEGEIKIEDNGQLIIKGCDTLKLRGSLELEDDGRLTINECATLLIEEDLTFKNNALAIIDGNIVVGKRIKSKDKVALLGEGTMKSGGKIEAKDNSTLFGDNVNCNQGPCAIGSGISLPIILNNFNVNFTNNASTIEAKWETFSETNISYFSIYYSIDGENFSEVKTVLGAGNSNSKNLYRTILDNPNLQAEKVYIRLRQTDFNGKFKEFDPIVIHNEHRSNYDKDQVLLFPNPGDGKSIFVVFNNFKSAPLKVRLFKSSGDQVLTKNVKILDNQNSLKIELLNGITLDKGLYFIRIEGPNSMIEKKYIAY